MLDSEDEAPSQNDEKDILDSSIYGPNAKLFSCSLCDQKFTNKLKITIHWSINHGYKLCALCSNYAFRYDCDKIQHERQHFPFGCSSCGFEFNTVCHGEINEHYKKTHQSILCIFCSSVIEPFSMFAEHVEKKHNVLSFNESTASGEVYEVLGDTNDSNFHCKMCNKTKRMDVFFGHYVFYHNLSIQALRSLVDKTPGVLINGSSLPELDHDFSESIESGSGASGNDVCKVCEKTFNADSNVHDVFCQGFVMCKQKECDQLFEDQKALTKHLDFEHPEQSCKFGCKETDLKVREVDKHLQQSHDIIECSLCHIINSSGNFKNHLRDKHSVNLMTYEKAQSQSSSKLYRVENLLGKKQVLCNFCDRNITKDIREFSFIDHYQDHHEIHITAILRNLDKNPIIDVVLNDKKLKTDEDCLKNFTIVIEKSLEGLVETDFDTSKVYCIGSDKHMEQKPQLMDTASDDEKTLSCEFCHRTKFDDSCRLYEHMTESHGFKLLNVSDKCNTCHVDIKKVVATEDSKSFNLSLVCPLDESFHVTKDNFKNHMAFAHLDQTLMMDKILYKCFECNFVYNKLEDIRNHFKEAHPDVKMNYCRICRFKLQDSDENNSHFSLNHADDIIQVKKFCCKLCKKSFTKKSRAKTHFETTHKKKDAKKSIFKCRFELCQSSFDNKEDRKMHQMIAHPDEKMFPCKTCPLKFTTKSSLSSHNMIHKNVVNTCEYCSKTFLRRDSYKEHLLIHSGVRQKCSFCEKTFVQRSNLVRHERIHLNEKPYKCSFCEKTFSDKGACTSHEKVHTKSEHSNCEVCGKHFARKQKLKYHMRIHTLENVLTCFCGKIFTESYSFKKHNETHLKKGRSDKCDDCGKVFKSAKVKRQHMKSVHGEAEGDDDAAVIETKIQCTLCKITDFTMETIKDHLSSVHEISETNEWENYIGEVEFEMDPNEIPT